MELQIGDRIRQVSLLSKDGNKISIEVDGKVYNVDVCMFADGQCSILHDGTSYNPFIVHDAATRHYSVQLNNSTFEVDILDSKAKYLRMHKNKHTQKHQDVITAPMSSKIIKIFVHPGQVLKAGDCILIFEAMKMQSTVQASQDCLIEAVLCKEGDSITPGNVLVKLKSLSEE